jgi:hypothetical protein
MWSCLGKTNGSWQLDNGTMAMRGALSGPNGIFVGSTVSVTKKSKARAFVGLTVAGKRCQHAGGCGTGAESTTSYCKAHGGGRRCQHAGVWKECPKSNFILRCSRRGQAMSACRWLQQACREERAMQAARDGGWSVGLVFAI